MARSTASSCSRLSAPSPKHGPPRPAMMAGESRGKLDGIPIAHKDIYGTAGIRHHRPLQAAAGLGARHGRHHGPQARRGRHRHARQARHARIRLRRPELRPALAARPQSLGPRPLHLRLLLRHRRRDRGRADPGRHRLRHRRLDPRPRRPVRHRRHQADLRPVQPVRRPAACLLARPHRPDGLDSGRLRPAPAGHGRL